MPTETNSCTRRDLLKLLGMGTSLLSLRRAFAAARPKAKRSPNVILLLTDDQRPDTIGVLGNRAIRTPNLDALVRRGTTFTRAVSPNPICTPARAEIMTGCDSFRNGVLGFGQSIRSELPLLAQTMRGAGYHTWYVGKWHNDGRPTSRGYESTDGLFASGGQKWATDSVDYRGTPITGYRGWVFQDDTGKKFPDKGVGLTPDISREFADAAIRFIRRRPEKPFFLHVNFTAPHDPLLVPPGCKNMYDPAKLPTPPNFLPKHPFDHGNLQGRDEKLLPWPRTPEMVRADLAVYYAVITHMDQQIGRILAELKASGLVENTIVIFTSDQGLAMGSHGLRGKQNMYDHTIGVPLVVCGPPIPAGRRVDAQCYLRDLYPTICELAGIATPKTVQGHSLLPLLRGKVKELYPCTFGYFRNLQRMVRTDRWKLIHYPQISRVQLFDLHKDPYEMKDCSADPACADVLRKLKDQLRAFQKQVGDPLTTET